jgi:hypothetical protein
MLCERALKSTILRRNERVMMPRPQFRGAFITEETKRRIRMTMRQPDAYRGNDGCWPRVSLEVEVAVYDVNQERNQQIMKRS